jgi:hypothetical protein
MEILLVWICIAVVTALAANARGRSGVAWFIWGVLFSGFALLAVLVMNNLSAEKTVHKPHLATKSGGAVGRVVTSYRSFDIRQEETGYSVAGSLFSTQDAARNWIDSISKPQTTTPALQPAASLKAATRLMGDGIGDQPVVGTANFQTALTSRAQATNRRRFLVVLTPEPENRHDPKAVCVKADGQTLGYLPADDAKDFHEDMARLGLAGGSAEVWARPVGGTDAYPIHGLRLDVLWPLQAA